jgi:hypothetical protein
MWSITMNPIIPRDANPADYIVEYLNFYDRQIYYSDALNFLTHHVCPVRGAMIPTRDPIFELDPSCLYSLQTKKILNYYYFKSTDPDRGPYNIISKYYHRNIKIKGLPFGVCIN